MNMAKETHLSSGVCFWEAPAEPEAGIGPGWKAWLGEVVAERARCGEPWADCDGEPEAERGPPKTTDTQKHSQTCITSY